MMESQGFKRFPAIRCWISHILEGKYINAERFLYTIFGKVKRVRFSATIIEKREILTNPLSSEDSFIDEDEASNIRIEFDLDDGTGLIRAIIWQADIEKFKEFERGMIVDIVGLVRYWNERLSISPEIIREIKNPNLILLRSIDIIKKIKSGAIEDIPEKNGEEINLNDFSDGIDVDSLFEGDITEELDELKEKIFILIEDSSLDGNGISFKDIKLKLKISEDKLKRYIRDLEMESRIYQSDDNIYQSY
ncbi:MAG: OB-fold nucleic acid binding domain-containing protein [Candidatus Hodarchaeota archaeon]